MLNVSRKLFKKQSLCKKVDNSMFCSTIIATVGRSTLDRAVSSVLAQEFTVDDFEIIVVNDTGVPLPKADWQKSDRVQIINTNERERSVARNAGAAIAKGNYLHFLDDDDWLLPGALQTLWTLSKTSTAAWLYGGTQLVNRRDQPLIQLKHRMKGNCFIQTVAGEWIPLQTSLIRTEAFFAVGGFNPLIPANEDIDLSRRFALRFDIAGTDTIVGCIGMGQENSTTDRSHAQQYGRWAREPLLNERGVFNRMRHSAHNSYWHGRIVRAYLTSFVWNLQGGKMGVAASRAVLGAFGLVLAGHHLISVDFWQAVATRHHSKTFQAGFQEIRLTSA